VFIAIKLKYILIIFGIFLIAPKLFADSKNQTAPQSTFFSQMKNSCNDKQLAEALLFISDYEACLGSDEQKCTTIADTVNLGLNFIGLVGTNRGAEYSARRLLSMANFGLRDAIKKASDNSYRDSIMKETGGKEINNLIAQHGGDRRAAKKAVEDQLIRVHPSVKPVVDPLTGKTYYDWNPTQLTHEQQTRLTKLLKQNEHLTYSVDLLEANESLMTKVSKDTAEMNGLLTDDIAKLDKQLSELDEKIKSLKKSDKTFNQLKAQINNLENLKKLRFSEMMVTDTHIKEIAEAYNKIIQEQIKKIQDLSQSDLEAIKKTARMGKKTLDKAKDALEKLKNLKDSGEISRRTLESIKMLKAMMLKVPKTKLTLQSRLILNETAKGFGLADVVGKYKKLPVWAQKFRLSMVRAFPEILIKTLKENPGLDYFDNAFIEALASKEHDRYREFTINRLTTLDTLSERRRSLLQPGEALLSQEERFTILKKNWPEVKVDFKDLSKKYKDMTVAEVEKELAVYVPNYERGKKIGTLSKAFMKNAVVGKLAGKLMRYGIGWGGSAALFWYDAHDYYEGALSLGFQSDYIRDKFWDSIAPSCRLPDEKKLNAPDPLKKVSRYLCACQEKEKSISNLPEICQVAPSEMASDIKKYCTLARAPGRDHDLHIAKAYAEIGDSNPKLKKLLQKSVGCEVMKNQPSNCRFSTEDVTSQGLYFLQVIRDQKLYKPIAELCPDVCQHWVDVANKKIAEFKGLDKVNRLPKVPQENHPPKECEGSESFRNPPPDSPGALKKWVSCQPKVLCQSSSRIRINIDSKTRYEVDLDPLTQKPKKVTHHFFHEFGADPLEDAMAVPKAWSFRTDDIKTFQYDFNEEGQISQVTTFDFDSNNQVDKVMPPEAMESYFSDDAHNSNSSKKIVFVENFVTAKRVEMFLSLRKAIDYCCNNEMQCGEDNDSTDPTDTDSDKNADSQSEGNSR
jgi:hypothetical protein